MNKQFTIVNSKFPLNLQCYNESLLLLLKIENWTLKIPKLRVLLGVMIFLFLSTPLFEVSAATISRPSNNIGLVGYWNFEIGKNGDTAYDMSGNSNNGTLTNATTSEVWVDSKDGLGQALDFDGVDDYINVPADASHDNIWDGGGTVSYWIKPRSAGESNVGYWLTKSAGSTDWTLFANTGTAGETGFEFNVEWSGGTAKWRNPDTTPDIDFNNWHHIVLTYNTDSTSNDPVLYIDNTLFVLTEVVVPSGTIDSSSGRSIQIGNNLATTRTSDGYMDDVRIYNRALSASEVSRLYKNTGPIVSKGPSEEGLVGHWTFEDGTGTIAGDYSGNGNDGTLQASMTEDDWVDGKLGTALDFDGSNDSVSVPTQPEFENLQQITVAGWFKTDSFSGNFHGLLDITGILRMYHRFDTNDVTIGTPGWSTPGTWNTTANLSVGVWYHVAATYDYTQPVGTGSIVYINGSNANATAGVAEGGSFTPPASAPVTLGVANLSGNRYYDGVLDDFRIYNRILSAEEMLSLYENSSSIKLNSSRNDRLTDGLVGLWSFDGKDMYQTTAIDRSGNGNNGTLTNGPTPTDGKIGQALDFDGVDDSVVVTDTTNFDGPAAITYSAWINTSSSTKEQIIVAKSRAEQELSATFNLRKRSDNSIALYRHTSSNPVTARSQANSITTNTWQHVVVTWTGVVGVTNNAHLYIDGTEVSYASTGVGSGTAGDDSARDLSIGKSEAGTYGFEGKLDDVRVYNRVLSADEIWQLYNIGR